MDRGQVVRAGGTVSQLHNRVFELRGLRFTICFDCSRLGDLRGCILARFSMLNRAKCHVLARFAALFAISAVSPHLFSRYGAIGHDNIFMWKDLAVFLPECTEKAAACRWILEPGRCSFERGGRILPAISIVRREGEMIGKAVARNISWSGFMLTRVPVLRCAAELYPGHQTQWWNSGPGTRATRRAARLRSRSRSRF